MPAGSRAAAGASRCRELSVVSLTKGIARRVPVILTYGAKETPTLLAGKGLANLVGSGLA